MEGRKTPTKKCSTCRQVKSVNEYYSKGDRQESSCKACSLERKKMQRLAKRRKSEYLKSARQTSKTVDLTSMEVLEVIQENATAETKYVVKLLEALLIDVAREGNL